MEKEPIKAVLDTNIIVSALIFGGNPQKVLQLAIDGKIEAYSSPILLAELSEVLLKKFKLSKKKVGALEVKIKDLFKIVNPTQEVDVLNDSPDNRVLEAARRSKSEFIITGDRELLELGNYQGVKIITALRFLEKFRRPQLESRLLRRR